MPNSKIMLNNFQKTAEYINCKIIEAISRLLMPTNKLGSESNKGVKKSEGECAAQRQKQRQNR